MGRRLRSTSRIMAPGAASLSCPCRRSLISILPRPGRTRTISACSFRARRARPWSRRGSGIVARRRLANGDDVYLRHVRRNHREPDGLGAGTHYVSGDPVAVTADDGVVVVDFDTDTCRDAWTARVQAPA